MRRALRALADAAVIGAVLSAALATCAVAARSGDEPRQPLGKERTFCTGRPDTAWDLQIKSCTALIQSDRETIKTRAIAYNNRGIAYYETQDYGRAVADYDAAIRLDPELALAYYNRGNAHRATGDNDRAIVDYSEALRIRLDAHGYYNRGSAYRAKGEYDRAIADYNEAIRLNPRYANAYGNRGLAYAAKGDLDRAIADYDEALRIRPGAIDRNNRGLAYHRKTDYDRAIADYDEAIRLDPRFALAYNNRGEAYRARGDNERAVADFDQAIILDPNYSGAYFGRGRMLLYGGSLAKAHGDLKRASELAPKNAYHVLWLDVAERRSHLPRSLPEAASQLDMTRWPAPVIRLLLGKTTSAAVLADDPDPNKKQGQACEANFFGGEAALLDGAKQEAARLFRLAANDCPRTFFERTAANAELKALDMEP